MVSSLDLRKFTKQEDPHHLQEAKHEKERGNVATEDIKRDNSATELVS